MNGYAGKFLKVDLSRGSFKSLPTTDYVDGYIGGRGLAARFFWENAPPEAHCYDPENWLIFSSGPVAGFPGFAGYRWQACARSPIGGRDIFSYANFGGRWGVKLKYAGYDGLAITGKADNPVLLKINSDEIEILDAVDIWGMSSFDAIKAIEAKLGREYSILTIGPAAENMVSFATIITDEGASGSGGLGGIMGVKKLKAIAVAGRGKFKAAHPEALKKLMKEVKEVRDKPFYLDDRWGVPGLTKKAICFGCGLGCARFFYRNEKGEKFKSFCQAAGVYKLPVMTINQGAWNDTILLGTRLCDSYGLDSAVMMGLINWLWVCFQKGLIREEKCDLPLSKIGTPKFIRELTYKISSRHGFGELLAEGTKAAGEYLGGEAEELLSNFISTRGSETKDYDPRVIPVTSLLYATEPRRPIQQLHEPSIVLMMWLKWINGQEGGFFSSDDFQLAAELFWGGSVAADFTTLDGKPLAAKKIQDRTYAKESLIFCDFTWPMIWAKNKRRHVGDPTLENRIFSAISGIEISEAELHRMGERIFNLQRAIMLRQGWLPKIDDTIMDYMHTKPLNNGEVYYDKLCRVPGKDGQIVSKIGTVLDKKEFEKSRSEYYTLRGWNKKSGLPKRAKLKELELDFAADDLEKRGLLG